MGTFQTLTFWIPGTPKGQGRPKITTRVRFKEKDAFTGEERWGLRHLEYPIVRSDPDSAKEAKRIRRLARDVMAKARLSPLTGPVFMACTSVFRVPESWSKTKKSTTVWHTDKPDATNVVKLIEDAGNTQQRRGEFFKAIECELLGVLWIDDAQVSCQCARKVYGAQEGTLVTIADLDPASLELRPADCQGVSWPVVPQVRAMIGIEEQLRLDCFGIPTVG